MRIDLDREGLAVGGGENEGEDTLQVLADHGIVPGSKPPLHRAGAGRRLCAVESDYGTTLYFGPDEGSPHVLERVWVQAGVVSISQGSSVEGLVGQRVVSVALDRSHVLEIRFESGVTAEVVGGSDGGLELLDQWTAYLRGGRVLALTNDGLLEWE